MYIYVRQTLKVPFLHEYRLHAQCFETHVCEFPTNCAGSCVSIGKYITRLHKAIRQGSINLPIMEALRNAGKTSSANKS